jgi:hypothetical protein
MTSPILSLDDIRHPFFPPSMSALNGPGDFIDFRDSFAEAFHSKADPTKAAAIEVLTRIASNSKTHSTLCKYVIVPLLFVFSLIVCIAAKWLFPIAAKWLVHPILHVLGAFVGIILVSAAILAFLMGLFVLLPKYRIFHHLSEGYTAQAAAADKAISTLKNNQDITQIEALLPDGTCPKKNFLRHQNRYRDMKPRSWILA